MQFGEMDKLITFQENIGTRDDAGQMQQSWADISNRPKMFAARWVKKGREGFEDSAKTATNIQYYKIHFRTDLSDSLTLQDRDYPGKRFDIRSIEHSNQRNRFLIIRVDWTQGKYSS